MSPNLEDVSPATLTIEPLGAAPDTTIVVPGSKSHTNRALVCAALALGRSQLEGALFAQDTEAMMAALGQLGITVEADRRNRSVAVDGCGGKVQPGPLSLDVAQSGTTSRFLLGFVALGSGPYEVDGDAQLRSRPMGPLLDALRSLGVRIDGDHLPVVVCGPGMRSGTVTVSGSVSSQFLSGLLLAAPYARSNQVDGGGEGLIVELSDELVSKPYIELTLATMADFGVHIHHERFRRFVVPGHAYEARTLQIEPDASAATYFFAAAAITGGRVRIPGLGTGTVQGDVRFVDLLERMGARVQRNDHWIEVTGSSGMQGIDVDMSDMSDAAQTMAVVATFAETPTTVRGIGFVKYKETDRISAVVNELRRLGIEAEQLPDGFIVHPGRPRPGRVATYGDHRMAMSFALLGLRHRGITLEDPSCVNKTFPEYFAVLEQLRTS